MGSEHSQTAHISGAGHIFSQTWILQQRAPAWQPQPKKSGVYEVCKYHQVDIRATMSHAIRWMNTWAMGNHHSQVILTNHSWVQTLPPMNDLESIISRLFLNSTKHLNIGELSWRSLTTLTTCWGRLLEGRLGDHTVALLNETHTGAWQCRVCLWQPGMKTRYFRLVSGACEPWHRFQPENTNYESTC